MTWQEIALQLAQVPSNYNQRDPKSLRHHLARLKQDYVAQKDQHGAKAIWCFESIINVQEKYLEAFADLKARRFYAAWCTFERVEIEYSFLRRHLLAPHSLFCLDFILEKTHQWQSLFPYRMFFSMEFIKKGRKCMICSQPVSLRKPCGHLIGEIYDGEMCCHEITDIDWKSISMVTNPHHKYAVAFPADTDWNSNESGKYDSLIHVIERLETPFDEWKTFMSKRAIPREEFNEQEPNSFCRCGSMEHFSECCFHKSEILVPWVHVEIGDPDNYSIPDFLLLETTPQTHQPAPVENS